jgi:hypothetical protein
MLCPFYGNTVNNLPQLVRKMASTAGKILFSQSGHALLGITLTDIFQSVGN